MMAALALLTYYLSLIANDAFSQFHISLEDAFGDLHVSFEEAFGNIADSSEDARLHTVREFM